MHEGQSKEELAEQMRLKVQEELSSEGPSKLIIHNLENFAYRYIETSTHKGIQCQMDENRFWVESIEPDILEALKWQNKEVKQKLIELCKDNPGPESKNIQLKLILETILKDRKVICRACLSWDFPNVKSEDRQIEKVCQHDYEDYLELRNKHAAWLEELTDLFL